MSKIRGDGATGAKFEFYAYEIDKAARERVRNHIPHLRTFYDAVALVLQGEGKPFLRLRGKDY